MASKPQILIVVGSAGVDPWLRIEEEGQKTTWATELPANMRAIWVRKSRIGLNSLDERIFSKWFSYRLSLQHHHRKNVRLREERRVSRFGRKPMGSYIGHRLLSRYMNRPMVKRRGANYELRVPYNFGLHPVTSAAMLAAVVASESFDYIVRVTSTQYLRPDLLAEQVSKLPHTRVYGGFKFDGVDHHPFMSGAFNVLSRDVAESVVRRIGEWRFDVPDDVGLGWLVEGTGIADLYPLGMETFREADEFEKVFSSNAPAIRCRPTDKVDSVAPSLDLMLELHAFAKQNL